MPEAKRDFELIFFERLVDKYPKFVDALVPLAELYTRKGLLDKGLDLDRRVVALRKNDPIAHYNLACSLALLKRKQDALAALEDAIKLGYCDFAYMKRDSDLATLHPLPKFRSLISKRSGNTN
jgi:tetratricopeptide (TPR) repeat protein